MKSKKLFQRLIICCTLLCLTSCITKALWSDPFYEERINHFLVGADGRYVVFIGDQFHYVFTDNSGLLKEIMSLKQRDLLSINNEQSHLKLDSENNVVGKLVANGPFSIMPPEDKYILQSFGIRPDRNDEINIVMQASGRRYVAKYLGPNVTAFNRFHLLRIYYSDNALMKGVGKAAVTPISVTLDAILLIGKVIIYPLGVGDTSAPQ